MWLSTMEDARFSNVMTMMQQVIFRGILFGKNQTSCLLPEFSTRPTFGRFNIWDASEAIRNFGRYTDENCQPDE